MISFGAAVMSVGASAIVIRDDVPDTRYRVPSDYFPALADLPEEGHAVLISPCWLVTAAHAVTWQKSPILDVTLFGRQRPVKRIVVHPGYHRPPRLERGDSRPLVDLLLKDPDIALLQLATPVRDVHPAPIYRGHAEVGRIAEIIGKGASGNGITGEAANSSHRTVLRRAFNRVTSATGQWVTYRFDSGRSALPLEGMQGGGDSGGPLLIENRGEWKLDGLTSWKRPHGDIANFRPGVYGQTSYQTRVSYYRRWISRVMASSTCNATP